MRSAPSRRITSPLIYVFSMMWRTSAANCSGRPSSLGNGTAAARLLCASSGSPSSMGVWKMPGAMPLARMPNCANSRHAMLLARLRGRGLGLIRAGHVAGHCEAADLVRHRPGAIEIDVEAGDLGAGAGELLRSRGAEARGAAGHDGGVSFDVHDQL